MPLTPDQLQEIRDIINRHHTALIARVVGEDVLSAKERTILEDAGMLQPGLGTIEDAYLVGHMMGLLESDESKNMGYQQFRDYLRENPMPLTADERRALGAAKRMAAKNVRNLAARVNEMTDEIITGAKRQLLAMSSIVVAFDRTGVEELLAIRLNEFIIAPEQWEVPGTLWKPLGKTDPNTFLIHVVRHPAGFLNSWKKRYYSTTEPTKVLEKNHSRLLSIMQSDQSWNSRICDISKMSVQETELWYWVYCQEEIYHLGKESPNYKLIIYEDLCLNAVENMCKLFEMCGLPYSSEIKQRISTFSEKSIAISNSWRENLSPEEIDLSTRILQNSLMKSWWRNK